LSSPPLINAVTRDDLRATIGGEKLDSLTDRFAATLALSLGGDARLADDLGREAHTLVSMAGMLGYDALSQACRDLEQAAKQGGDLHPLLDAARRMRDDTLTALGVRQQAVAAAP
jgi:HPt (histidine-containing phosphotransfer) domain-containing protein